jgi:hypothetical protein
LEDFITQIKVLDKKIDFTKMEFTTDHRTLLVLMLGRSPAYNILVQIWSIMPDGITGEKAIRILWAKDQRLLKREDSIMGYMAIRGVKRKARGELT